MRTPSLRFVTWRKTPFLDQYLVVRFGSVVAMEVTYTDAELIAGLLARDRKRIDAFVLRYGPHIQSAAARVLSRYAGQRRGVPSIADAVQEIFVQLWKDDLAILRRFDAGRGTLGAYLWTVAQHAALRLVRPKGEAEVPLFNDDPPDGEAGVSPQHQRVDARDELEVLFAELAPELDDLDRALIERRFIEEQPTELICVALRLSPAAFYQRISRLKKLIKETAERLDQGPSPSKK